MIEPTMCYNITLLWGQREHLLFKDPQLDLVYVYLFNKDKGRVANLLTNKVNTALNSDAYENIQIMSSCETSTN